jgi:hypothetical protein
MNFMAILNGAGTYVTASRQAEFKIPRLRMTVKIRQVAFHWIPSLPTAKLS